MEIAERRNELGYILPWTAQEDDLFYLADRRKIYGFLRQHHSTAMLMPGGKAARSEGHDISKA